MLSSDNSSSDEDLDCLLQRASNKLGWSSHKNYEDTFQTLLRNVEDSRKKPKAFSVKTKRQTPRVRDVKPSSPILSSSEVPTPKRILSFSSDVDGVKEKSETNDKENEEGKSVLTPFNSIVNYNNHVSSHHSGIETNYDSAQNSGVCKPALSHTKSEENCPGRCSSNESLPETNLQRTCSSETLSSANCTVGDENGTLDMVLSNHDKQVNACVTSDDLHSWLDHRGGKGEQSISSDSEEDKSLPAISLQGEENSEEGEVVEDSTPPSLSQRLVDNFHKKKKENGGLGSNQIGKEKLRCDRDSKKQSQKPFRHKHSSSSDDDFETFLMKLKTPQKTQSSSNQCLSSDNDDDFINDDPITEGEEEDYLLHLKLSNDISPADEIPSSRAVLSDHTNKVKSSEDEVIVYSSSDDSEEEGDVFMPPVKPKWKVHNKENLLLTPKTPINKPVLEKKISFLESLNTPPVGTPVRSEFVKDFKKRKEELAQRLFTMFNKTVFEGKLPVDMEIRWNKRMRKTAGYCVYTKGKLSATRNVRLELSEKVCDSAERLRDTLVHEMCHAACWLINGVNDGHGRYWKYWATKANIAHPEIPVVKRCHSYEIHTKYKYQCQQCKAVVGRHSKSIDVSKKCCGLCKGRFVLLPPENQKQNKRQQPNKFALFVKENYASVKKSNECFKHADVMRALSQEFARKATLDE